MDTAAASSVTGAASDDVQAGRRRLEPIDLLRGIIIVIIALDHVHDFFGEPGANPVDLATTTAPLFFTRWITHFCALVLFLLTGTGAFLTLRRMTRGELSRFLVTRGLWLIVLETLVMRSALQFNFDYQVILLIVLWALGWAMIVLVVLIYLPTWVLVTVGVAMVAGHNLLDGIPPAALGALAPLCTVLHVPGFLVTGPHAVFVTYPLVPWLGVTALGYALGSLCMGCRPPAGVAAASWPGSHARLRGVAIAERLWGSIPMVGAALAATDAAVFPRHAEVPAVAAVPADDAGAGVAPAAGLRRRHAACASPGARIRQGAAVFYVLHFYLIHLLAVVICYVGYRDVGGMFRSPDLGHFPFTAPPGWGLGLPWIYTIWIGVVLALYPLCRWYADLKRRRGDWWLSYL